MSNYILHSAIPATLTAPTIVELSPDGRFICIGGNSRKLHVIDPTKSIPPAFYTLPSTPTVIYWNQEFILVGLQDGSLTIFFYCEDFDEFIHGAFPLREKQVCAAGANNLLIFSASFNSKDHTLALSTESIISIFDLKPKERHVCFRCLIPSVYELNHADPAIMSLAFTSSGSLLVSHSTYGILLIHPGGELPSWDSQIRIESPANSLMRFVHFARDARIQDIRRFRVASFTPTSGLLVGNGTTIIYDTGLGCLSHINVATGEPHSCLIHSGVHSPITFGYHETAYERLVVTIQSGDGPIIKVWRATKPLSLYSRLQTIAGIFTVKNLVAPFVITLLLYATSYGLFHIFAVFYRMFMSRLFPLLRDMSVMTRQTVGQLLYRAIALPAEWIMCVWRSITEEGDILGSVEKVLRGFEEMGANDVANEF
ncbi:hypothetical protein BDM02DRAFT_3193621 [Thelephora ganbajun]|uniref:Uncharacterized protein n=1 Tax=Thelephora ganbajun TaxID=370292 RepID=A0ACB6YY79_THEGA|nr:hypothetical protein BDM02DRAFT_3193621 [Thelephora ganbajun]